MLEIKNLNSEFMNFGPVSFKVKENEIVGISGESGAGKSVLLKAIADMVVHEGEIYLHGEKQNQIKANEWRKQVSLLPAEVLFWNRRVKDDIKDTSPHILKVIGFEPDKILQKYTEDLSSGEKQRIGLLRLLENRPKILLLDEPSANLDEENKRIMEQIIFDYLKENHAGVIWVGHDREQLERVSSKIYEIKNNQFRKK